MGSFNVGKCLKIINLISAALLGIIWVVRLIDYFEYFYFWDLLVYLFMIFFATLLIICEFKGEQCKKYFFFLFVLLGRGVFNIFLASVTMFGWRGRGSTTTAQICYACGITLLVLGIIYIVLHFLADKLGMGDAKKEIESGAPVVKV